jgi:hypothetical protein
MTADNFFFLENRLIQTSQMGGQWYSDTSPLSIPWSKGQSFDIGIFFSRYILKLYEMIYNSDDAIPKLYNVWKS